MMHLHDVTETLKPTALQKIAMMFLLGFTLLHPAIAQNQTGYCHPSFSHLMKIFPVHTMKFPVDHFHNESRYEPHSDRHFENRFWFDDRYYRPGGPVIIQNAGEITGDWHLNDLLIGLHHELARATNGLAVLLEHRYYGHSHPVDLRNAKDFRFLTTEQAMADQAYFARNVVFPGKEHLNLTAPNTPWFAIGCSYPGALTAYERIQYPDLFWAALSSSGVTVNTANNWEYSNVEREYGPAECVSNMGKMINIVDNILLAGNETQIAQLKPFFGFPSNASNIELAVGVPFVYGLQSASWLGCLDAAANPNFCRVLASPALLYPKAEKLKSTAEAIVANGGWANETDSLTTVLLNYVGYGEFYHEVNSTASLNRRGKTKLGFPLDYLTYTYQQCTEIGGFITGADEPLDTLPIISRLITFEYVTKVCKTQLNLTGVPESSPLDKYGQYNVSYPRLMLVGGEADPWRPSTPLAARDTPTRLNYSSTLDQPWHVIPGATHCWDWPGVFADQKKAKIPPASIKEIHELEKETFRRWLREWHDVHPDYNVHAQYPQ